MKFVTRVSREGKTEEKAVRKTGFNNSTW